MSLTRKSRIRLVIATQKKWRQTAVVVLHPQPDGNIRFAKGSVQTTSGQAIAVTDCAKVASTAQRVRLVDSNITTSEMIQMNFLRGLNHSNRVVIYCSEDAHVQEIVDLVSGEGKLQIESISAHLSNPGGRAAVMIWTINTVYTASEAFKSREMKVCQVVETRARAMARRRGYYRIMFCQWPVQGQDGNGTMIPVQLTFASLVGSILLRKRGRCHRVTIRASISSTNYAKRHYPMFIEECVDTRSTLGDA
ncbi:hypothetical protein SISNIDRAFT_464871 [Sistotremastrum niveocremeum HHB9708]|uniref:Uncharacterized protein n=1 Tax=Sistotremastrum niveocremeum HHB9708 TaxID=1314777 RepID=A0A164WNY3_9AGAM|nr:hypothetical protein SISNIDRAFT_464871 [Sistotremastrum niveocremeum HHB9708]